MRMWMVPPRFMCRKHLLGEHVEIHMLMGTLRRARSVEGFLQLGLLAPQHAVQRHAALVREMERRGYRHASPLDALPTTVPHGRVSRATSLKELARRCPDCRKLILQSR